MIARRRKRHRMAPKRKPVKIAVDKNVVGR